MVLDYRSQKERLDKQRPPPPTQPRPWWKRTFSCLDSPEDEDAIARYRSKAHLSDGTYTRAPNSFAGGTTGAGGAGGC